MTSAYDLSTHLGAYLYEQEHFHPNGFVAFVSTEPPVLRGFADASGNDIAANKILTVNGCLSTPDKWCEFNTEWQDYLKHERFKPDPTTGKYVFHTSSFHTGNLKLMPNGLSENAKARIYNNLIGIICKYTVFRFGFCFILADFRQVEVDYPYAREEILKHPGTFASAECFQWNSFWAEKNGYKGAIAYIFDRGDAFWGELFEQYRSTLKVIDPDHRTVYSLSEGNKADQSPLQAADLIAWECRNYSLGLSKGHLAGLISPKRPRPELNSLLYPGPSHADIRVYGRKEFIAEIRQYFDNLLTDQEKDRLHERYIGEGKLFPDVDGFIRHYLAFCKEENIREKQELLDAWRSKKKGKSK